MARQSRVDHLLSSNGLADRATGVCLRAQATKAIVSGMALADAALEVERGPIRVQATTLVKAKGATARGKAKAAKRGTNRGRRVAGDE